MKASAILKPGMFGEVFNHHGQVAGLIPSHETRPDAIQFCCCGIHPATKHSPKWADISCKRLDDTVVELRLNPDISLYRLYDVIVFALRDEAKMKGNYQRRYEFQGESFVMWPTTLRAGDEADVRVIMIDTEARISAASPKQIHDGQHKHGAPPTMSDIHRHRKPRT